MSVTVEQMEAGRFYRIFYRNHGGDYRWREWELTAKALDVADGLLMLSGRPLFGTTELRAADVLDAYTALPEPFAPKRVQGGRTGSSS